MWLFQKERRSSRSNSVLQKRDSDADDSISVRSFSSLREPRKAPQTVPVFPRCHVQGAAVWFTLCVGFVTGATVYSVSHNSRYP
jgi:hypothetical protein